MKKSEEETKSKKKQTVKEATIKETKNTNVSKKDKGVKEEPVSKKRKNSKIEKFQEEYQQDAEFKDNNLLWNVVKLVISLIIMLLSIADVILPCDLLNIIEPLLGTLMLIHGFTNLKDSKIPAIICILIGILVYIVSIFVIFV